MTKKLVRKKSSSTKKVEPEGLKKFLQKSFKKFAFLPQITIDFFMYICKTYFYNNLRLLWWAFLSSFLVLLALRDIVCRRTWMGEHLYCREWKSSPWLTTLQLASSPRHHSRRCGGQNGTRSESEKVFRSTKSEFNEPIDVVGLSVSEFDDSCYFAYKIKSWSLFSQQLFGLFCLTRFLSL